LGVAVAPIDGVAAAVLDVWLALAGALGEGAAGAVADGEDVGTAGAAGAQAANATASVAITRTWTGADRGM